MAKFVLWIPFLALSEWLISDERRWTFEFWLVVCCVPEFFPWYLNGSPVSAGASRGSLHVTSMHQALYDLITFGLENDKDVGPVYSTSDKEAR